MAINVVCNIVLLPGRREGAKNGCIVFSLFAGCGFTYLLSAAFVQVLALRFADDFLPSTVGVSFCQSF